MGYHRDQSLVYYISTFFFVIYFFSVKSVDISSYADDTTLHTCCKEINLILEKLRLATSEILKWFKKSIIKANPDKCHLLTKNEDVCVTVAGENVNNGGSNGNYESIRKLTIQLLSTYLDVSQ